MADQIVADVIASAKDGALFVDSGGTHWRVTHRPSGPELAVHHLDLSKRQGWLSTWTTRLVSIPGLRALGTTDRPALKAKRG